MTFVWSSGQADIGMDVDNITADAATAVHSSPLFLSTGISLAQGKVSFHQVALIHACNNI